MLSINTIARVDVNVQRYAAQPTSFDTGLLLVKDSHYTAEKRLKSYANSAEAAAGLVANGFSSSTEAYKAAQTYFAASPSPGRLLVSCHPASESLSEALDAVLDQTASFYGVVVVDTHELDFVKTPSDYEYLKSLLEKDYPKGMSIVIPGEEQESLKSWELV